MSETRKTSRTPFWIKGLLVVSLAINLAILGGVAGLLFSGGHDRAERRGVSFGLPYIRALAREDRKAVRDAVRQNPDLPGRQDRRAQFSQVLSLLRADAFDRNAVESVLAAQAAASNAVQFVSQNAWLDRLDQMTPDERRAYADRVEEILMRGQRKRRED